MKYVREQEMRSALALKAIAHPTRCWIIKELTKKEHCVGEFVRAVGVEFATMSRHLAKLKQAGFVSSRKCGREIRYFLNRKAIEDLFTSLLNS